MSIQNDILRELQDIYRLLKGEECWWGLWDGSEWYGGPSFEVFSTMSWAVAEAQRKMVMRLEKRSDAGSRHWKVERFDEQ